jgi:FkbM family methyltransferase
MLNENIRSAGLFNRIEVRTCAAGNTSGQMNFYLGPDDQTGWGGLVANISENSVAVTVEPLDDLLPDDAAITVLKIDAEGADAWVLEGAERLLLQRRISHVFFECNRSRMANLGIELTRPQTFLAKCGYRVTQLTKDSNDLHATPV